MTYVLNVVPLGSRAPLDLWAGRVIAEIDDPPLAFMAVAGETLTGIRYLLVTDDGSGYKSSAELVRVPSHAEEGTVLSVPDTLDRDLHELLTGLLASSPERRMAVYLEANRAISREDLEDPFPTRPTLIRHGSLQTLWDAIKRGEVEEEEIRVVG